ncbi:FeoB-associated Cys-rich membrane protein [Faecalibacter rhinopitheci]|uniref:FeoB-associated Cys-rich membrane protein n=1 Tax=Faecalibacter rhinopitheci TaxID=2779678 RepID=A0A8J7FM42_9FLAO|nr:FeoB-associated Cys-rich membrane protein [Faecalibacter rhinopitheci]MBF0596872.1 FeoB-associated Cys-rich membrane protein [Faecalibacter rhinopitheci]
MDNIYIQYAFIAFLLGFAVWYIIGMIKNSFKKDSGGCSKGCGCSSTPKD